MTALPAGEPITARVQHSLTERLLAHQLSAQVAHVIAISALLAVLWDQAPHPGIMIWAAAVVGTTVVRAGLTAWARRRAPDFTRLRRSIRIVMVLLGLAWGLGAAALAPNVDQADAVLLLAVLATLAAGAGSTLVADPVALGMFSICLLAPLGGEMIAMNPDRLFVMAGALVLPFTAFTIRTSREAYRDLTARLETAAVLEDALANVRRLSGLLPICASCKEGARRPGILAPDRGIRQRTLGGRLQSQHLPRLRTAPVSGIGISIDAPKVRPARGGRPDASLEGQP